MAIAQHGCAALSKMSATSAARVGSTAVGFVAGPGVTRSSSRAVRVAGRPARRAVARLVEAGEAPAGDGPGEDLDTRGLALAEGGQGAEERAEGVDLVLGAQHVLLAGSQGETPTGRHP